MNPYQPPITERKFASLPFRLYRGISLAVNEYRRGLRRDNISFLQHIGLWLSLIAYFVVALLSLFVFGSWALDFLPQINTYSI